MLSVGSRDGERKGLGFGGGKRGMEENELEEGEARSGQEDDACVDPDVALSYIDEKLQDVLGHFQKDFEGGVSAENLGAKFGGYGSFLPAYQRSPSIWSQPRSPQKLPSHNGVRSPYNPSFEGAHQNPSAQMSASISKNNTASTGQPLENSGRKGMGISALNAMESISKIDSNNRLVNGSNQNTLKVRIKLGPGNISVGNNAAIYSGLGLDISPSSSPEDSPDGSGGHSPELRDVPHESPMTILQTMARFPVLAGYLLSPLPDSLLCLTERGSFYLKNCETDTLHKGITETSSVLANLSLPVRDSKCHIDKKVKSDHENRRFAEVKNSNYKDDISTILKRVIDIETLAGQELVSDALNIPLLSNSISIDEKTEAEHDLDSKALTITHLSGSRSADGKAERHKIVESAMVRSKALNLSRESTRILVNDGISSPDLVKKNLFESKGSMGEIAVGSSGNETARSKGKQSSKLSSTEKSMEEQKAVHHKDASADMQREGEGKIEKDYDIADIDGFKGRTDQFVSPAEPVKQIFAPEVTSYVHDGEKMLQGKNRLSEGEKKLKGSHINGMPSVVLSKENLSALPSVSSKEKKKSSHAKGGHSDIKSNALKSHKESSKDLRKESRRDNTGDVKTEQAENRTTFPELHTKVKLKDMKLENEKLKERLGGDNIDNPLISNAYVGAPVTTPLMCNVPTSDAVAASNAPVVVKDNWVCCDKCQKWRLLPYGTNPDDLPKKWLCNMQFWLPIGMNRCNVSEEETTKAINPQYQAPVPESDARLIGHYDLGASCATFSAAQHFDQSLEANMESLPILKKKHGLKDTSIEPDHSAPIELSKSMNKNQKSSRILNDVNPVCLELDPLNKVGFEQISKSTDLTVGKQKNKQKEKHKIRGSFSDGGHYIEKSGKHSKLKSKREVNHDGFRTNKKIKTDGSDDPDKNWDCVPDVARKAFPNMGESTGKNLEKCKDKSSLKDTRCNSKGNFSYLHERSKVESRVHSDGDVKEYFGASNIEKSDKLDLAAKKRKVKEWHESQGHQETVMGSQQVGDSRADAKEEFSEIELRREKKAKVSKYEGKESSTSKADGRMDKTGCITRIPLSGSREQHGTNQSRGVAGRDQSLGQYQGNAASQGALDGIDSLKRDSSNVHPSTAATSSSSKVSGSLRSKSNFQEARGSPIESVTSSPFKVSHTDKLAKRRNFVGKDDTISSVFSVMESPKRYSDAEVDGGSDQSGTRRKEKTSFVQRRSLESHKARESRVLDSLGGTCDYQDEVANQLSGGEVKGGRHVKTSGGTHDNLLPTEFGESNLVSCAANTLDQHNKCIGQPLNKGHVLDFGTLNEPAGNGHVHNQGKVKNHRHKNGFSQWKSGKSSLHPVERDRSPEYDFDKSKLKVSDSFTKQEFFSARNTSSCRYEADIGSHYNSSYHEDLRNTNYNFQEEDEKGYMGKKDISAGIKDHGLQENLDTHISSMIPKPQNGSNSLVGLVGASCGKSNQESLQPAPSQEDEKSSNHPLPDQIDQSQLATGRGNSQSLYLTKDERETQSRGPHSVPKPFIKGSRSAVYPTDAPVGTALKVIKQPKKSANQNVVHHSSTRHTTPNELDTRSPIRKDGHSAATLAMKEARDLKHLANRLKNEGRELESTCLYFQAALKFLNVASLLEPSSVDSTKQGEVTRSMQMYTDTAKLCEYCAHEYERCKKMAAAALAYKLMEVAYFKVAYLKQPIASKDRNELQTALQMVLRGESPSSSASDVDNLNNQGTLDKAASAKGVKSPQIAGNHVIAARSCYTRWLDYTNETIFAFEASKRSQNAFAAATASLEKDGVRGISSVKEVLNFNFLNVEEILRLTRISMESISC